MRHVALLRGINVGGANVIRMAALKQAFESMGYTDVRTILASGNVVFTAPRGPHEARIEKALAKAFSYEARVLVRSESQLRRTVQGAPRGWPDPATRCYVVFVKSPLTAAKLLQVAPPRSGVDTVAAGPGAVYYGTRKDARTRSGLQKLLATPAYQLVTIREYATCARVLRSMEG